MEILHGDWITGCYRIFLIGKGVALLVLPHSSILDVSKLF